MAIAFSKIERWLRNSFYKILAVFIIGVPITPLVWQFMTIYREKNARDKKLSQWEEVK